MRPLCCISSRDMSTHDDGFFDTQRAASYDDDADAFDPAVVDPAVDFLAELAGDGPALEFAVGTGRIAIPLSERGVSVHGIELSRAMVTQMQAKPGGEKIPTRMGDMATTRLSERFSLVYLVYNTIMNLTRQADQVACFKNAAQHLEPGGRFVVEVLVPRLQYLAPGETKLASRADADHWCIDEFDVVNQGQISHHVTFNGADTERYSVPCRYVWPAELDLMAELAGMRLTERWGGWQRQPFTHLSEQHVSVWQKS